MDPPSLKFEIDFSEVILGAESINLILVMFVNLTHSYNGF
jgi:hypothetical protein